MNKTIKTLAVAGGVLAAAKGLDNRLQITSYTLRSARIPPEFDGYKIAQISDVHSDTVPGLVSEIARTRPDIIVSTGDLVHHTGGYSYSVNLCRRLSEIAPVYAVTGNHDIWRNDYSELEAALDNAGVQTLHNESVTLTRGGARLSLSGIDDPFAVTNKRINEFLNGAVSQLSVGDEYSILLFHRANWLNYFRRRGFDLILSGHMHGGQMRIPSLGGVVSPRSSWASSKIFFPKYVGGLYAFDKTTIIVSRGLGNPMVIPRFFNRPELVSITLKHKGDK
ncbi:MAG: metallophosphoesterase [Firmicutes bacterium]|nr:metallophosphoesterase [Bacillota bacterium]